LRGYIFTSKELDIIEQYLKTGKRTPAFNKLLHYVRHNHRILDDARIYLTLLALAHRKRKEEPLKLPPGRPSKLMSGLKGAAK
jgi:DNA polymerase III epsilon subunit-like protein